VISLLWYFSDMAHARKGPASYTVQLGARGRIVLPAELRRQLDLHEGDRLVLVQEEPGVLRLLSAREAAQRLRGALRPWTEGRSLVDELARERRLSAARE
jgi:AbrB family looped-hinge helix DNA binding protein